MLGGHFFDIITMKPSKRKQYALDGNDPLDEMDAERLVH
jgi:hypothetical protein